MRRNIKIGYLVLFVFQCGLLPAESAVYRWVDDQGRTQFGDRPPLDKSTEEIKIRSAPQSTESDSTHQLNDQERKALRQKMLDSYQDEREEKRQARKKREDEAAERKKRCVEAKNRLRDYEASSALYNLQPDGTRVFLTKEQFAAERAAARKSVKKLCGSGG